MLNTFNLIDGEYDCDGDDDGDDDDRMDVDNETEDGDGSFNHSDRLYLGLGSVLDYDFDNDDLRDPNYQNPLGSSDYLRGSISDNSREGSLEAPNKDPEFNRQRSFGSFDSCNSLSDKYIAATDDCDDLRAEGVIAKPRNTSSGDSKNHIDSSKN